MARSSRGGRRGAVNKMRKTTAIKRSGGFNKIKKVAKVAYNVTKPYHKQMAKFGIQAAGAGLSAATGNPAPAAGAAALNSALFSNRNRNSRSVTQHPTGAKT